ncbi:MAG: hypothetical protein AB7G37_07290 [Solirubrobacteraceae bacterium]
MPITDPQGQAWKVRRRWLPWRRRIRDVPDGPIDVGHLGDDPISMVIGVIALILAIPALVVLTILLAELLLLIVLLPVVVLLRMVAPVPWTIEASVRTAERPSWLPDAWSSRYLSSVRGWRGSTRRMDAIASDLRAGRLPPADTRAVSPDER